MHNTTKYSSRINRSLLIAFQILIIGMCIGCTSIGTQSVKDQSNFTDFRTGTTTKDNVYTKLGQPDDVFTFLGRNGWRYISADTMLDPGMTFLGMFVPVLMLAAPTRYDISQVELFFDADGKLLDITIRKSQSNKMIGSDLEAYSEKQHSTIDRIKQEMTKMGKPFDVEKANKSLAYLSI